MVRRTPFTVAAAMALCAALSPACAQSPQAPGFASSGDAGFDAWRAAFAQSAVASGRDPRVVETLLAGLAPEPRVVTLDRNQPEFVRPVWDYIDRAVSRERLTEGRALRQSEAALFARVEEAYGVDADVIAGIWAVETNFGTAPLPHHAPQAIATLAHDGRRRAQFETYLLALIDMVAAGYAGPAELRSSWAGALGQPQFMPDVYLSDAVDWDGDGRRDIWRSRGDTFASIANYLVRRGWKRGEPVFDEVRLPQGFDYATADGRILPAAVWAHGGVTRADGGPFDDATLALRAELFLPAGADGPALLLYDNFRAIRAYNPSDRYAMAVALLAFGFEGGAGLRAPWPRAQGVLQKPEMLEVQQRLAALGYDPGDIDGVFGGRTRAAVRAYQAAQGLPADGWASPALLARLRGLAPPPVHEHASAHAASPELDRAGVIRLQRALAALGHPIGRPTGGVGPRTRAAIRSLERELGLAETGRATRFILAEAQRRAKAR